MHSKIKIFFTGGTFDKEYNELTGELYVKSSQMNELWELGQCRLDVNIATLIMVDSIEMSNTERNNIIQ